uniref:P-type ATPase C-terminal domain-containing protein n=2 Tax=Panagrolaimus superbus TaxID=310955 RepID=A0A914Y9X5_9BILA
MVANQKYDQINNGYMEGEAFRISNSLFYLRPEDYPPTAESTPTNERSGRSTNIQTPSSSRFVSILNPADIVRRLSSLNISSLFRKEEKVKLKSKKQLKIYEAESPDEYCLVNAAKSYGFKLVSRDLSHVNVTLPTQREYPRERRLRLSVQKILKFDSNRKRMSVVLDLGDRKLLFCKGADDEILANLCQKTLEQNLQAKTIVENSKVFLKQYSRNGLRTLCMAMKFMSNEEYNRWEVQHEVIENSNIPDQDEQLSQSYRRLETNLKFLGLTAIEDRLQDGVEETISSLRKAGIQIWVLTGDKKDTAINIAKSCQLFDSQTEICACSTEEDLINLLSFPGKYNVAFSAPIVKLLENGNLTAIAAIQKASAVLCYRMTPCEKETVVKTVKKYLKGKVLAVGDGANDVPMIQSADVGIGISGQEGLQAVMASDFALARFKFLKKLLLVHGHWFYYRLANVLLYFLYKNAMFVFVLYWAQFYSGFSANGIMDP